LVKPTSLFDFNDDITVVPVRSDGCKVSPKDAGVNKVEVY
ncbi:14439_t:CDS:1, partial [Dentiscutata heterogama]